MLRKAIRYFNTSGPNIPAQHYTLMRPALIEEGRLMVERSRYFTIWAPRQSGKSTYFRLLGQHLQTEGYEVCHINVENFKNATEAYLSNFLAEAISKATKANLKADSFLALMDALQKIEQLKLTLIIDEIEGINPQIFNQFLHTIRSLYHSRETHCLKSVILVGVSNITGIIQDNASPFNIVDNLELKYFSQAEVFELLEMHEAETGQIFSTEVKEKIYSITAGQPGLVNGFAYKLTEENAQKERIEYADYLVIEHNYLSIYIDKNISNIINKGRQHRAFIEKLLFWDDKIPFQINDAVVRELSAQGLISYDTEYNIVFVVPLYKKALQVAFYPHLNGESQYIKQNIDSDIFLDEQGLLKLDLIIRGYQEYAARRGFRYFLELDEKGAAKGLKEAALIYSFETYIQSYLYVLNGKSYLEPHVALGRSDLIINVNGREFVMETKIYRNITQFNNGKRQLAYYAAHLGLKSATYLVFAANEITHPKVVEAVEEIEGVEIRTYLVRYDLKTDFEAKD